MRMTGVRRVFFAALRKDDSAQVSDSIHLAADIPIAFTSNLRDYISVNVR